MTGSHLQDQLPQLALVIGGARSGKSALAERLLRVGARRPVYLATAEPSDAEMRARIQRHQEERGTAWHTVEAPRDPDAVLRNPPGDGVLLDCATLWLSNHLLADSDLDAETVGLMAALAACPVPVVVVSNEVGWSIVPDNALARRFRDAQGRLNQTLAARAGLVLAVMAGLPLTLKGRMPGATA